MSMWAVRGALALVVAAGVLLAGFALAAGLGTDATAGVSGRPFLYWLIAPTSFGVSMVGWPILLSWFVELDLPEWHRKYHEACGDPGGPERIRTGRTIVGLARSMDPKRRPGLAARVVGYGLLYVFLSILVPVLFGVAGTRIGRLGLEEALPLALAFWVPLFWLGTLIGRSRRKPRMSRG